MVMSILGMVIMWSVVGVMQVMFGTTDGQVVVMSAMGLPLAQVTVSTGSDIVSMAWSCSKFVLSDERQPPMSVSSPSDEGKRGMHSI